MCINCAKKSKKWGFPGVSAIFSTLVTQIDSISHMMVVLNVSQHVAVVIGHAEIWKYVILHIDLVNMRKNSLFLTLTGL